MADTSETTSPVSRRMWIAGLSGGLLSVPFVWWLDIPQTSRVSRSPAGEPACCTYVDRDGWMLTPDDVAALAARPPAS